ncbi:MAG: Rv3235 family protein [Actinomycetia bacterium]|nr:Rv3235 family protein [Actinomycetes bacterium]
MTISLTEPRPAGRKITVRPAPRREPPFDDELSAHELHLIGPYDQPLPFVSLARPSLTEELDPFAAQPTGRGDLPDPTAFARRLLVATLEVLSGRRPMHQLTPHMTYGVYSGLTGNLERPERSHHWREHRSRLHSVRLCEPADGVAELSAVITLGRRYHAAALRLEGIDGRWRCVYLKFG